MSTLKDILLILIGIIAVAYSLYQKFALGVNFFLRGWGIYEQKDFGAIFYFVIGAGCIVYGIFDPNAKWNIPKKK